MSMSLLPANFDQLITSAVREFWSGRGSATGNTQGGARDAVVGGKNMNGFVEVVRQVVAHCGLPDTALRTRKSQAVLPGYFRATKNWDVLVIHGNRLLGVFEFKSQVGSFGNNFNNRSEEVIGSAADLWVAHYHGAYGPGPHKSRIGVSEHSPALLNRAFATDPRPPFLAWLMLLEECNGSMTCVRCDEPNFKVFEEFQEASYARRYQILCERLMERQLYSAAALELTPTNSDQHRSLSTSTSIKNLFAEFAGRLLASQA